MIDKLMINLTNPTARDYALRPLLGLSVVERNLRAASRTGFSELILVCEAGDQPPFLSIVETARALGMKSGFAQKDLASLGTQKYLLLSGEHLATTEWFQGVRHLRPESSSEATLICDPRFGEVFSLGEVGKALIREKSVQAMEMNLREYNTLSTGIVIGAPSLLSGMVSDPETYLSHLAREGKLGGEEVSVGRWFRINSNSSFRHAAKTLLVALRRPTDNFVSRKLNRPISLFLSKYLVRINLRPDVISLIVTMTSVFCFLLQVQGDYWGFLLGALFYHLASILDGCDGEVARLKFQESQRGEWIDTAADTIGHLFYFSGLIIGLYVKSGSVAPIIVGICGFGGLLVLLYTMFQYLRKVAKKGSLLAFDRDYSKSAVGTRDPITRAALFLKFLMRRATFAFIFLLLAAIGRPEWILFLFALGTNGSALFVFLTFRKQLRLLATSEEAELLRSS